MATRPQPAAPEDDFQAAVIELARYSGWRVAHFRSVETPSGHRTPVAADGVGYPDLTLVRERTIWVELKSARGRRTEEQRAWGDALEAAGAEYHVWRPDDWEEIERVLARRDHDNRWMVTVSGRRFYPLRPRARDVAIEDIAHALAHLCRFGGHVDRFYSVAQHSVYVSEIVDPDDRLWALLHDAAEAYVGDLIWPLKHGGSMAAHRRAEDRVSEAIATALDLDPEGPSRYVKRADWMVLLAEARDLMGNPEWAPRRAADMTIEPYPVDPIEPWSPEEARERFLARYEEVSSS